MKRPIEEEFVKLPKAFYLVTLLATLNFVTSTVIQPFFSLYIDQKISTTFELGLIISLMSYTTLIVRLPLGLTSYKLGTRARIVPLALIGQTISNILYSMASQPIHFLYNPGFSCPSFSISSANFDVTCNNVFS